MGMGLSADDKVPIARKLREHISFESSLTSK